MLHDLHYRVKDSPGRQMLEAEIILVHTFRHEETRALLVGLDNLSETVQFKLVLVEDVIYQDNLLVQPNGDVHPHRNPCYHEVNLIHEVYELSQWEESRILGAAPGREFSRRGCQCRGECR